MKQDPRLIEALIVQAIPGARVFIEDMRGDGRHFGVMVESGVFNGLTVRQQHDMVYHAFGVQAAELVENITLRTVAPAEARRTGTGG